MPVRVIFLLPVALGSFPRILAAPVNAVKGGGVYKEATKLLLPAIGPFSQADSIHARQSEKLLPDALP
jgi:hypothetical protein